MKIIFITLLVYNFIGTLIYFKDSGQRTFSLANIFYLVGMYLPIVFAIDFFRTFAEWRAQKRQKELFRRNKEEVGKWV
ncbi:MAG: hypothetical protein J6Y93_03755 [Treponema sp.]|nr:hypothetical protein [Treponema sp.]